MTEAAHWETLPGNRVLCRLCPTDCRLRPGQTAPCGTRANRDGRMVPLQYGRIASAGMDPIEKKPLYHFHPGRSIYSVAAHGCNLHCRFCQNWNLSQSVGGVAREVPPADLVAAAAAAGSVGIAYTYSEPLVWFEYLRDVSRLAAAAGLKNVIVSNAFLHEKPLRELLPDLHAANFDLKSMKPEFYTKVCKGKLEPVLRTIALAREADIHVEVTNLVIPGLNDADEDLDALARWVAELDRTIPLHLSAYRPAWRCEAPPTTPETLARAVEIAREHLDHVYAGNLTVQGAADTHCAACGAVVIERDVYRADSRLTDEARCPACKAPVPVVVD